MIQSAELQSRIAVWRAKATDGTLTQEEMREAIQVMRQGRMSAATSSASRKAKVIAAIPSADDLLNDMGL